MIAWCYPVLFWAIAFALAARPLLRLAGAPERTRLHWLAGLLALAPVDGMPLGRWLSGFIWGFSIPTTALMLHALVTLTRGRELLDRRARRAAFLFGAIFGTALYPLAMGWGPLDPYSLGWRGPLVPAALALVSIALIWRDNAFGYVLLAAGAAWQLGALESQNAWDYVVDPLYWLVSIAACLAMATQAAWRRRRRPTPYGLAA